MVKRAIKAFQNLQLTEHHIDSLQQSAAGAGGGERRGRGRCGGRSAAELARRRAAMLRHRPPYISRPYHRTNSVLVPVRVPQLSEASFGGTVVDVQRALLGGRRSDSRHRRRYGRILPRTLR